MMFNIVPLFLTIAVVSSATWRGRLPPKPLEFADREGCYVRELRDVIPYGGEATLLSCIRVDCGRHLIEYASCPKIFVPPNCYIVGGEQGASYPDCCPYVKCDDDNTISKVHDEVDSFRLY